MDKELYELVKRISRFQDSQWEEYIISQDRYYRYFGKEDICCIRDKAHELGEKTAGEVQKNYGNLKKALEASQVKIRMAEDQEFLIPGRICFGQYYDNEILVRIRNCNICTTDWQNWNGMRGHSNKSFPFAPGHEACGSVQKIGAEVDPSLVNVGDYIAVGYTGCGACDECRSGHNDYCRHRKKFRLEDVAIPILYPCFLP